MPKPDRNERLAEQLRANLKKRKQQERARGALVGDQALDDIKAGDTTDNAPGQGLAMVTDQSDRTED